MELKTLTEQMKEASARTGDLKTQASGLPAVPALLQETFQELQAALEELHVAEAELRQQNEELYLAQQSLEAERRRYQELFDLAPESYLVTDLQGIIREANSAAAALLGVSARTLKGKPIANYISIETRSEFRQQLLDLARPASERVRLPLTLAPRQGAAIKAEAGVSRAYSASKEPPALLWVIRDLTERLQAEQARLALVQEQAARWKAEQVEQQLRAQSSLLETLVTMAPTGFAFVSTDSRFLRVNDALAQILEVPSEELVGKSAAAVLGDTHWQRLQPIFRQAAQGLVGQEAEIEYKKKSGEVCHLRLSHYAVKTDDAVRGIGLVVSDITERKSVEATLQAAYDREHRIAEVLQRSLLRSLPESEFSGLSVAAFYEFALAEAQIGGDFYDVFLIDDGKVALLVGDVSGKGLAAAASTAEIKYAARAFLRETLEPQTTMERLNDFMCEARQQGDWDSAVFAVLSMVVVDRATGQARIALAGAEPILLHRTAGEIELVQAPGMLLGIEPSHAYAQTEVTLLPGDTLLMATDGITEARRGKEFLGIEGLSRLLQDAAPQGTAQAVGEAVLRSVQQFVAGPEGAGCLSDDACVLVVQRQPA